MLPLEISDATSEIAHDEDLDEYLLVRTGTSKMEGQDRRIPSDLTPHSHVTHSQANS